MLEKQKQEVGNNSLAIQAEGNVTVTPYLELKAIFLDLFDLNFPKIQQLAKETADKRVECLLDEMKTSFEKHKNEIDKAKFAEPGMQYEMQAMAIDVARKGDKSNLDLLCELFCTMMSKDCPELIELIASEARRILPMLSKKHVSYLSLEIMVKEASFQLPIIQDVDKALSQTLNHIHESANITYSDLQYITCAGAIVRKGITHVGVVPNFIKDIPELKVKNADQLRQYADQHRLVNIIKIFDLIKTCHIGNYDLTAVGRLIGWLNLSKYGQIDIKQLFK